MKAGRQAEAVAEMERELSSLSGMVIEREREIRGLTARLREANERHDRSIASLEAVSGRLEEIQSQARGQATRIRMKALREAVEVGRRVQELNEAEAAAAETPAPEAAQRQRRRWRAPDFNGIFEGLVKLEIGPLGDFSQLVGFEDAVGQVGASEISVERFSEGRATLSMRLDQPVDLLRELEELSELDFKVRHTAPDNLILDVDEDPGRAARRVAAVRRCIVCEHMFVDNPNHKGNVAELAIAKEAVKLGLSVLKPLTEHERYDLVIGVAGRLLRVQCKWGAMKGDVVCVRVSSSYHSPTRGYVKSTYDSSEIDVVAVYCDDLDCCYLLPIDLVAGRSVVHLRLDQTRNNQRAALNWAADYEFVGL